MKTADAMSNSVLSVAPDTTLQEAAMTMAKRDVGMLAVSVNKEIIGTLTDRDLSVNGTARGADPSSVRVGDVMTPGVVSCPADADLDRAAELMSENKVRRVLVTKDNAAIGVLSLGDLAKATNDPSVVFELVKNVS